MNNSFGVGCIECVGNLDSEGEYRLNFHRTPGNAVLYRQAIEKLHRDESVPIVFANVINSADVRVVQGGCCLRLSAETGKRLRVTGNFLRQELEGDETM